MGVENKVALYIRISLEDDDIQEGKEESDSVTNQRALLRRFVSGREDLAGFGVAEFLDDGYTGRNLDRPGVQGLIGQCREGWVYRGEGPVPAWEELCGGGEPAGAGVPFPGGKGYLCE